jgi:hypothetical protein
VVVETGHHTLGFEVKFSSAPKVTKGFWQASDDIGVHQAFVVSPVQEGWAMAREARVISPLEIPSILGRS